MEKILTIIAVIIFAITIINSNKPVERDWINAPTQNTMMPLPTSTPQLRPWS